MIPTPEQRDYDYIIIGSGFGGSVSALRLAEMGYKVLVLAPPCNLQSVEKHCTFFGDLL